MALILNSISVCQGPHIGHRTWDPTGLNAALNTISYKLLVGISPNFQLGADWDRDELITFQGQKVKDEGHNKTKCSEISTLGGIAYKPLVGMTSNLPLKLNLSCKFDVI